MLYDSGYHWDAHLYPFVTSLCSPYLSVPIDSFTLLLYVPIGLSSYHSDSFLGPLS
jgi:hypothetical protein